MGGNKVLMCGNGGSACHAQHLAAELVGRSRAQRAGMPAMALSSDGALLSCLGNDFCFETIFSRQIEALGKPGDVCVVFSTSGNSENIVRSLDAAHNRDMVSMAFLGRGGGRARGLADFELIVAHDDDARIQEAHQLLIHAVMDEVEAELSARNGRMPPRHRHSQQPRAAEGV